MPGLRITTGAVAGPSAVNRAPSGTWFVTGLTERGPANEAVIVTSLGDFIAKFGNRPAFGSLYDAIELFFQEGGTRAHVVRVVGAAATTGALATPLVDNHGTPAPTLQFAARGPGAWSSGLSVEVLEGSVEDTFTVKVRYQGSIVKTYANLRSPQDAVARMMGDAWVSVTDMGSATTAPNNNPVPVGPVTLTAGTDDRNAVTSSTYVAALGKFEGRFGDGAVSIPGLGDGVHEGLIAHAAAYNRIAILATARNTDKEDLLALAASYDERRAGLFAPWVRVPNGVGGIRAISPEGYIAAARARAHESVGPWRAGAASIASAQWVVAPDEVYEQTVSDELDEGRVNAIVSWIGGVENYGWRSLSVDETNWGLLSGADTLNRVVTALYDVVRPRVFDTIDALGQLLATIEGAIEGVLRPLASVGGLYPWIDPITQEQRDPGYSITVNSSNNPTSSLAQNRVFADVKIRVSPTAALITLSVSKAGVTAQL